MAYIGVSPSNGIRQKHTYTASAGQTSFSGAGAENISLSYKDSNYVDVYRNGVKLSEADYTSTSGTAIVLPSPGASENDMIEVVVYDVFSAADTVSKADGGQFDGNVTMAGTLAVTGETTLSANLNLGDNDKAIFGAGPDLEIYSDGTYSRIMETGGLFLVVDTNGSQISLTADNSKNMGTFIKDGAVQLFFSNAQKFSTTSTGIDITGTVVSDGMSTNTAGTSNFRVGVNAGNSIASGSFYNTVVGDEAGTALTTGDNNVAVGFEALKTEDENGFNTAVGVGALKTLNAGTNSYNTALGYETGKSLTTGIQNVLLGATSGDALTDADFNVAIGVEALGTDTKGNRSVAIGYAALFDQNFTSSTDVHNVAIGNLAGTNITTGNLNTLVGSTSGDALTVGITNVAYGFGSLTSDTAGNRSTALGYNTLQNQNFSSSTDSYNTAVGFQAGINVTTGLYNTLIGGIAGDALTDADYNTALGYLALSADTQGNRSTALGSGALKIQNFSSATNTDNTAVGYDAGREVTTATKQTFLGNFSGKTQSTGNNNTYIGYDAGSLMTTGSDNTILGGYNGNQDGVDKRTLSNHIVISDGDGYPRWDFNSQSWIGRSNAPSGYAYIFDQQASTNPFGLLLRTTNSADNDGNENFINCSDSSTSRFVVANTGSVGNSTGSYGALSDVKLKEQIKDASSQWNDIKALTVRKFKFKEEVSAKGDSDALWKLGVVAQEVELAGMNGLVDEDKDTQTDAEGRVSDLGTTTKTVKYSILYMKAVKALQEAMTRIETLEADVKALKG